MGLQFRSASQITREILDSLAGAAAPLTDANVGSALRTLVEAFALVVAELHYVTERALDAAFAATATGDSLDLIAREINLARQDATATIRNLTFTKLSGSPQVTVSSGTLWRTPKGVSPTVTYMVMADTTLAAGALIQALAAVSTDVGAYTAIADGIELEEVGVATGGIESVVTATVTSAGIDREVDGPVGLYPPLGTLRYRVLRRKRNPEGPGSDADLVTWALEVDGVGDAMAVGNTPDVGYADLYVLATGNAVPDSGLLALVQAAIDGKVAVGSDVTVRAPSLVPLGVTVTVTPAPGFDGTATRTAVLNAVSAYLNGLAIGQDALYAALSNAVWTTAGVGGLSGTDGGNYTVLRLAGSTADVAASNSQKITAGSISVS